MTKEEMFPITPIEEMLTKLTVESVFGKPTTENGVTVIPVAQVQYGFGYGGGYGRGPKGKGMPVGAEPAGESTAEGGGSGGGAGGSAIPRGYVRITPDGIQFEPIFDQTRIPLAGIMLGAWSIFWITATIRAIAKAIAQRRQVTA